MAASGECGRLRIGIHALIPRNFLAELIGQYRDDHPGIKVEISEGTARDTVMQLRADRQDIVFVAGTPELPDCHSPPHLDRTTRGRAARAASARRTGGHYDPILLRLAGCWPVPSILRFNVGRGTLLSMV
ncbi:MAG: LysR family transcriptional regulator, partial [Mesorhizobium sp.]